ncbi:MAG: hypothetical protein ABIO85_10775 [Sphingomicrobium sp.]
MRRLAAILLIAATLAGCASYADQPAYRSANNEADFRKALAGKTPGRPVDCLSSSRSNDMQVIDDNTILFREGRTTFVQSPRGGCSPLGSGHYTLVTQSYGGMGLCRGDIARVVDLQNGFTVGSCALDSFVPFSVPRRS